MAIRGISRPVRAVSGLRSAAIAQTTQRQSFLLRSSSRGYASETKQPGPTSQFYKTFTRPIAKVLVLAVFTYQVAYWGWVKLEADENRKDTDAEIADLEAKVAAANEEVKAKAGEVAKEVQAKKKSWW